MNRNLKKSLRKIETMIRQSLYQRPKAVILFLFSISKWCGGNTYFPDKIRKKRLRNYLDQFLQTIRFGYPNEFYFPYGFDVKSGKEMDEYLHYAPFMRLRDERNISAHSATAVLRDKVLFGMLTEYMGVKSAENIGLSTAENIFDFQSKKSITYTSFFNKYPESDLFIKPINGECGEGIIHLVAKSGSLKANDQIIQQEDIIERLKKTSYLIQPTVLQHSAMASLHPQSLNTIRLVTIRNQKTNQLEVFPSILRIGTGNSFIDNTSQGGIAVGIDLETGRLKKDGFYKPAFGTKVSAHPDSGIVFSDFIIPFFDDCKRKALLLHSVLPTIHSIGWDIAIGPDGPIFIEGNDNWEINGPQICNGGLKNRFMEACGK